jgi:hypothetical protein
MHLVLTKADLEKLSQSTRDELQSLLFGSSQEHEGVIPDDALPEFDYVDVPWNESAPYDQPAASPDSKVVININTEQAKKLVANLSKKSIDTLKLFAPGETVLIQDLVGEGKPYETFSELKRSFVGAVNRRLRTVTRMRTAVLFRKTTAPDGEGITVKDQTAESLCAALLCE